jgi:hypothetical protein
MKKLLLPILLLISIASFAQNVDSARLSNYYKSTDYGWNYQRVNVRGALTVSADTTTNKWGLAQIGSTLYLGNGVKWNSIGTGSSYTFGYGLKLTGSNVIVDSSILLTYPQWQIDSAALASLIATKKNNNDSVNSISGYTTIYQFHKVRDSLAALIAGKQAALGFTPENIANKTATASTSTTTYPNWLGIVNYAVSLAQRVTDSTANALALAGKVSLTKYQTDSIANVANLAAKVAYSKYQTDSTAQAVINVSKVNKADSSNVGAGGYATPTQLNAKVTVVSFTKNATRDSTILTLSDGSRLAVKDSVGAGGGGADLGGNGTYTNNQSNTMNGFSQSFVGGQLKPDSITATGSNKLGDTLQIVRGKHILCYGVSIEAGSGASQLAFSWPYLLAQTMGIPVRDSAVSGSLFQGTRGDGSTFIGKYDLIPMYDTSIAFIIIGNYAVNECQDAAPQEATYYTTFGSYMDSLALNKHYPRSKIVTYNGSPTGASTRPQNVLSRMADSTYNISVRKGLTAINSFRFCQQFPLSQFVSTDSIHPQDTGHVDLALCYFVGSLFGAKAGSISSNEITSAHNVTVGGTLNWINKIGLNMYGTIDWGNINSVLYDRVSFLDDKVTPRYAGIGYNTSTGNLGMTASGINMYFSNAANTKGVNLTTANSAFGVDGPNSLHTYTNFILGSTMTLPAINQNMVGYISFGAASGDYFRAVDGGTTGTRGGMGYNSPTGAITIIGRGTTPSIMFGHNTISGSLTQANCDGYTLPAGDLIWNKSATVTDSIVCGKLRAGVISDSIVTQSINGGALHKVPSSLFAQTASVQTALGKVPSIVASNYISAQTAGANIVTYTTGAADSSFIVSAYTNITAVTSDVIQTQYTYTDAETNTLRTVVFNNFSNTGTVSVGLAAVGPSNYSVSGEIRVKASTTITVATVLTTGIGTITYSSSATITKLHN